jgi:transposase InsO family protein
MLGKLSRGRPNHPQTQGKIERYHRTMKNVVKLENYYSPSELKLKLKTFVQIYNYERYHESLDNLTPADIYYGRKKYKLDQRKKCKAKTLKMRKQNYIRLSLKSLN